MFENVFSFSTRSKTVLSVIWCMLLLALPLQAQANNSPVITSTPETKITEDNPYTYVITATDADNDVLTFSVPILPEFLTFNSSTATLSGTPTNSNIGSHSVRVVVSDGIVTVDQSFVIEVSNANDAPTIVANLSNQQLTEDVSFTLDVSTNFTDQDPGDRLTFTAANMPSGLTLSESGIISGAPDNTAAQESPFNVEITATDTAKATVTTFFQIVVVNVNDAPEPFDDTVQVNEDTTTIADILENDIDVDNTLQPSTVFVVTAPTNGTATVETSNGLVTYVPNPDFAGTDTMVYRISDPDGLTGTATVTFNVINSNDAPIANNDVFTTEEDTPADIDVLANDTDIDEGDAPQGSQIIIESTPTNGSVTVANNMVNYAPNTNFTGTDSFSYKVADSNGAFSNVASVSITVGPVNDIPVAGDDVAATLEDTAVLFVVINNDSDTEDGAVDVGSINVVNHPTNGSVAVNSDGTMTYTPAQDFNGTDTLQYTITDSAGLTSLAATVTITVNSVNDAPVANNDLVSTSEDTNVQINVLSNDTDVDSNSDILASSLEIVRQPSNGSLFTDTSTGTVTYSPNTDYFGSDSFTYKVSDNGGLTTNVAEVQITVTAVNDSPRLSNDSTTTDEDTAVTITVLSNDEDIDGTLDVSTLTITQQPVSGTITTNSAGQVIYTPNLNFHGNDQFSYNVSDNNELPSEADATVLITINSINDAPVALTATSSTFEDKEKEITLEGTDVDEDTLTFIIVDQPANGTISGNGPTRTYTPNANYHGEDTFTFKANDGQLDSETTTVTVTVVSVNDRPVATAQTVSVNEDMALNITLSGTDIDNDPLTFSLAGGNLSGTITGSPPTIIYTPAENFNGQETLLFIANDGDLDSASEVISIRVLAVNDVPTVSDQDLFLSEDSNIDFVLEAEDIDEDTLTYTIVEQPQNGSLTGTAPDLTYTPNENYFGTDALVYKVNDGNVDSEEATISFDIAPNADAPTATAQTVTGDEDTAISITLTGEDPDGNTLSYQLFSNPIRGTLSGDAPNLLYHPNPDYFGEDSFQFKVSDGSFESESATIRVNINPVNDPPVAKDDNFTRSMSGVSWLTLDVLGNDTDVDGDELILHTANADFGSVSVLNNQLRYVPPTGFVGDVIINYLMSDAAGERDQAAVQLSIENNSTPNDPVIETPDDISLVATGRLTHVDLEAATAVDRAGNTIAVELLNAKTAFPPGAHTLFWKATDAQGFSSIASQKVNIFPLVSISRGQNVEEGSPSTVKVRLNGPAPRYPLVVPYTVSGSATNGIDFELADGQIRINEGTETEFSFNTFSDGITESPEEVVVSLGDTPYKSREATHTTRIIEGNIAPRAFLFAEQDGQQRILIENNDNLVSISADIKDGNPGDTHTIVWLPDERIERLNDSSQSDFQFSADDLTAGIYTIAARITDSHNAPASTETEIFLEVVDQLPTLGLNDSDGDLVSDRDEGFNDSDRDHIPDYLDPNNDCSILPHESDVQSLYLVEGESSGCLRLGSVASQSESGGVLVRENTALPQDVDTKIVGGLFDFQVHGLTDDMDTYAVVIPQRQPLPDDAVYRKYSNRRGWHTFVENDNNRIYSAQGNAGVCPPPKADDWSAGLDVGHWCVQLIIEDGGPNDNDGMKNGMINDPGGVAVYNTSNNFPIAMADSAEMTWNSTQEFEVLQNDSDADNDSLEVITVAATLGMAEIVDGEKILYTTMENYVGQDKVAYTISDGHGGIASSTLTITINGNSAPIANDDHASTTYDKAITINVLGNDTDIDGDELSIGNASADVGELTITSDQKLLYTPKNGFEGTATISYQVSDGKGSVDNGNLYIAVSAPPETPEPPTDNGGGDSGGGGAPAAILLLLGLVGLGRLRRRS